MSGKNQQIIESIRSALQSRQYDRFVALFAEDGVFETPFALRGVETRYEGIAAIRDRFTLVGRSPANELFDLEQVNVTAHQSVDPDVAVIELSMVGKLRSSGEIVNVNSSMAVVEFDGEKIKRYRDYPNSAGIAEAVGLLPAYAASFVRGTDA